MSGQTLGSSAVISACGGYRYRLDRCWDASGSRVCWVMLNPSTADASDDDPTLRRCIGFSRAWGHGSLTVVNLYAWRATNPRELVHAGHAAVGPEADQYIREALHGASAVVFGWGGSTPPDAGMRIAEVVRMACDAGLQPVALGVTNSGAPRHPLYLRAGLTPAPWDGAS